MAVRDSNRQAVEALLEPDEELLALSFASFSPAGSERGRGKRLGKDVAVSVAGSVALSAIGLGMTRITKPVLVWVAVSSDRLLLVTRDESGMRVGVDELFYAAYLDELHVEEQRGARYALTVHTPDEDRARLFRLGFGTRKGAGAEVLATMLGEDVPD